MLLPQDLPLGSELYERQSTDLLGNTQSIKCFKRLNNIRSERAVISHARPALVFLPPLLIQDYRHDQRTISCRP